MLNIDDITITYDTKTVLHHFSLQVDAGEIVCLSGESGRGKSSLLHAILGFVPLASGSISLDGTTLTPLTADAIRRDIAWLPQELSLPSEWVSEMVFLPFSLKANRSSKFTKEALFSAFDALGLEHELYTKRVSEISGGQRQRIMIAASSLLMKKLFIADEPTSALDGISAGKVMTFFHSLASKGKAILLVSHDEEVAAAADRHITL
jgi:putative ABC transport system ATP-binding protein